jgi:1,2-phenylacetyl-CoA epoxidase catalytic subunit
MDEKQMLLKRLNELWDYVEKFSCCEIEDIPTNKRRKALNETLEYCQLIVSSSISEFNYGKEEKQYEDVLKQYLENTKIKMTPGLFKKLYDGDEKISLSVIAECSRDDIQEVIEKIF